MMGMPAHPDHPAPPAPPAQAERAWQQVLLEGSAEQRWRNGGGSTRELFTWPPGQPWRLRVSVASIEQAGAFSPFEGVQRWFAVVHGAGVRLCWPGQERRLTPDDAPIHFDGANPPHAEPLQGPTLDLNLMLRAGPQGPGGQRERGQIRPMRPMRCLQPGERWRSAAPWQALYAQATGVLRCAAAPASGSATTLTTFSAAALAWAGDPAAPSAEPERQYHWCSDHPAWWMELGS